MLPKRLMYGGALPAIVVACLLVGGIVDTHAQSSALPSGWVSRDIGSPTPNGRTRVSGGTWTIVGGGDNVWGTADEFHFAYRAITGDVDISARVASFDAANEWSKAGLMIREALTANARNAYALLSPGLGAALQQRPTTGGATTRTESGGAATWVRLVRQGSRFTAYRSTDGRSWTTIATTTISMPGTVYVGFAVTSRDPSQAATGAFTSLQIGTALPTPWRNLRCRKSGPDRAPRRPLVLARSRSRVAAKPSGATPMSSSTSISRSRETRRSSREWPA